VLLVFDGWPHQTLTSPTSLGCDEPPQLGAAGVFEVGHSRMHSRTGTGKTAVFVLSS